MAQVETPNIFGQFLQGKQAGEQERRRKTLSDFIQPALSGDQNALSQVYAADPDAGLQVQGLAQRQQTADHEQRMGQLEMAARAWRSATPEMRQQLYPSIAELTERVLPQFAGKIPRDYNPQFEANIDKFLSGFAPVEDNTPSAIRELQMLQANPELAELDMRRRTAGFDRPQLIQTDQGYAWATPQGATPLNYGGGGSFGISETDNYVRNIMDKVGQVDPNASPDQLADQILPFLIQQESGGNPNAVSPRGARGLTQVMPETGRDPGFGVPPLRDNSPQENVRFGRDYLIAMLKRYPGRPDLALAAYNAGPGVADRFAQPQASNGRVMPAPKAGGRDAPSGYQWGPDGQSLIPIPGGPADRKNNPTASDLAKGEMGLRKELTDRVKEPRSVISMFQKVQLAAQQPSAANDLALIFAYMKMLDPGSVVREQEFANAQNAAGVPDQVRNAWNKALRGERLNENQRAQFVSSASQIASVAGQQLTNTTREYQGLADQYGYDAGRATGMADFRGVQSEVSATPSAPAAPGASGWSIKVKP